MYIKYLKSKNILKCYSIIVLKISLFLFFCRESFDNELPFLADTKIEKHETIKKDSKMKAEMNLISLDEFQRKHENDFQEFLKELKVNFVFHIHNLYSNLIENKYFIISGKKF